MAGATYQAIFQNPMADPYVMGVSSGAAFGATLAIVFLPTAMLGGYVSVNIIAFIFAILVTLIVFLLSRTKKCRRESKRYGYCNWWRGCRN